MQQEMQQDLLGISCLYQCSKKECVIRTFVIMRVSGCQLGSSRAGSAAFARKVDLSSCISALS